jgi:hypothetical protein
MRASNLLAALMVLGSGLAAAQTVTPPEQGGPPAGRADSVGRDAGPANHPPRTESPHAVNRGTDGSAAGLAQPNATGITPQGMLGSATAGAREPQTPPVGTPPARRPAE